MELSQEGSWKWILFIILVSVSWLVPGMVTGCSCMLGGSSQNPGMVSECVDVRARRHLGTWIDVNMAKALYSFQMDRKASPVPAVVAAPNPSAKED